MSTTDTDTATTTTGDPAAIAPSRRSLVVIALVGVVLVVLHRPLAEVAARIVPGRAKVSSGGTQFPRFEDLAPSLLLRTGVVLVVLPLAIVVVRRIEALESSTVVRRALPIVTVLVAAVVTGWLARPHNGFPTNARIHWVDYLTYKSDNFFYAAGRLPHLVFYEHPFVWQAINAGLIVALCLLIARKLGFGWVMSSLLATLVLTSGNITRFSNTAEDVFINLALTFAFLLALLHRRPVVIGLAIAALMLGRPQFAVVYFAVVGAELLTFARRRSRPDRATWIHLGLITGALGIGVLVSQATFSLLGYRYFLANGHIVNIEELSDVTAREIDGFTIFPLSGAYVSHFVWVLPALLLLMAAAAVVLANRNDRATEVTVYAGALAVVALLGLHEVKPLLYFNIRYVTYLMPFLVTMAWTLPGACAARSRDGDGSAPASALAPWRPLVLGALLLAPLTMSTNALAVRDRVGSKPEIELLAVRDELRDLADGRLVYVADARSGTLNYVSYVLRKPITQIIELPDRPPDGDYLLIVPSDTDPIDGTEPVLRTESFVVLQHAAAP